MRRIEAFALAFAIAVCWSTLCLVGCPPPSQPAHLTTTTISVVVSTIERQSFLELAREQPLTPSEAALLYIVENNNHFPYESQVEAAKALAEIEKARIALTRNAERQ